MQYQFIPPDRTRIWLGFEKKIQRENIRNLFPSGLLCRKGHAKIATFDQSRFMSETTTDMEDELEFVCVLSNSVTSVISTDLQGVSHTPRGVNTSPNFRITPPASGGKEGDRGRGGGEREGERRREGTPKGWLTPPMFQILKNTLTDLE